MLNERMMKDLKVTCDNFTVVRTHKTRGHGGDQFIACP